MATLENFLATGKLGDIGPGISPLEVKELLGEPWDVSVSKKPSTWKYGALQLAFYKESEDPAPFLAWAGLFFQDPEKTFPHQLELEGWWPTGETTWDQFQEFLQVAQVPGKEKISFLFSEYIEFPSGVRVVFDGGKVNSIQCVIQPETTRKQLSLSLPKEVWEQVKQEAHKKKISPAKLCSEWIAEKINGNERQPA